MVPATCARTSNPLWCIGLPVSWRTSYKIEQILVLFRLRVTRSCLLKAHFQTAVSPRHLPATFEIEIDTTTRIESWTLRALTCIPSPKSNANLNPIAFGGHINQGLAKGQPPRNNSPDGQQLKYRPERGSPKAADEKRAATNHSTVS